MGKQQAAGVELCCTQCYGIAAWFDEYGAAVGSPLDLPVLSDSPTEISRREYSDATVLVNAWNKGDEGATFVDLPRPFQEFLIKGVTFDHRVFYCIFGNRRSTGDGRAHGTRRRLHGPVWEGVRDKHHTRPAGGRGAAARSGSVNQVLFV